MAETINAIVRGHSRLNANKLSDAKIETHIERALAFVNSLLIRVGTTAFTISDFSAANTETFIGDELVALRALWAIFLELYRRSATGTDAEGTTQHISDQWREEFVEYIGTHFPGTVKVVGNKLMLKHTTRASDIIGREDARTAGIEDNT